MFDQFTTDLPSSLSDRVCRLGIVPEENNFVLAHAHVQLYRVHAGEESGGGGGCSVLTSSLSRRGQRSVLCLMAEAYRAVSSTGADDVEDSRTGDPSGTAQVLRADGRYSHGE